MLALGLEDHAINPEAAKGDFQALFPYATLVTLPGVGTFARKTRQRL
jgi:hypothetical protein